MIFNAPSLSDHRWFLVHFALIRTVSFFPSLHWQRSRQKRAPWTQHNMLFIYLFSIWLLMTDLLFARTPPAAPDRSSGVCGGQLWCWWLLGPRLLSCFRGSCGKFSLQTAVDVKADTYWSTLRNGGSRPHNVHLKKKKKRLYKCTLTVFEYFSFKLLHASTQLHLRGTDIFRCQLAFRNICPPPPCPVQTRHQTNWRMMDERKKKKYPPST